MKRAFIIHGWGGNPDEPLFVWLDKQLQERGYVVARPKMPNSLHPRIDEWIATLRTIIGNPDEETLLIGHSIGCQGIMRYMAALPETATVGNAVCIAGWFWLAHLEEYDGEGAEEIGKPWIETPIDFERIKKVCKRMAVFLSTNEPYEFVDENKKVFEEKLNARVIVLENRGHFTEEDNVASLPELLEEIDK